MGRGSRTSGGRRWWLWPGAVLAAGAAVAAAWAVLARGGGPLGLALRDPTLVRLGLIVLGSAAVLAGGCAWLAGVGRRARAAAAADRGLLADQRGTAVIEFALMFPILFFVVMIMVQAMMMMSAVVIVNYAAFAAARTAIVWVPKDLSGNIPQEFDPEEVNQVVAPPRSLKMYMIRAAAAYACVPVGGDTSGSAPGVEEVRAGIEQYYRSGSGNGDPPNWIQYVVGGRYAYAWKNTGISLESAPPTTFGPSDPVTVTVYHDFELGVPVAAALFGDRRTEHSYSSRVVTYCTLTNEGVSDEIKEDTFQ